MQQQNRQYNNLTIAYKDDFLKQERDFIKEEEKLFCKLSTTQKLLYTKNYIKNAFAEDDLKILFND
jgi:hypothetical protein